MIECGAVKNAPIAGLYLSWDDYVLLLSFKVFFAGTKKILQAHTLKSDITLLITTHLDTCLGAFPEILACELMQMCSILAMHNYMIYISKQNA